MSKQPIYLAFSTQKGGAGKTTLTVLIASYLHYVKGYDVAVIDCDFPQHSIAEMRDRDLKLALEDDHYKRMAYEQFTRLKKKAYPVIESSTGKAITDADHITEQADFDIVFFDFTGNGKRSGGNYGPVKTGLHYRSHQCRPPRVGKHPALYAGY